MTSALDPSPLVSTPGLTLFEAKVRRPGPAHVPVPARTQGYPSYLQDLWIASAQADRATVQDWLLNSSEGAWIALAVTLDSDSDALVADDPQTRSVAAASVVSITLKRYANGVLSFLSLRAVAAHAVDESWPLPERLWALLVSIADSDERELTADESAELAKVVQQHLHS